MKNNKKNKHLLILKLFQTCMSLFLMLSTKVDILKNAGNQTVDGSHWLGKNLWKSMAANILQNIFFCTQLKKQTPRGLEQPEVFIFVKVSL